MTQSIDIPSFSQFVKWMKSGESITAPDGSCPVGTALGIFRGRWKADVIYRICAATSLTEAMERITSRMGVPDVLVYNAAFMTGGKASELTPEEMIAHFKTDVVGAQVAAKCVIPAMKARKSGAILFTGGLFGVHPYANADFACMSMDKAALRTHALMLNNELKNAGIFVGIVNIMGVVGSEERLLPDNVAEAYWKLYSQQTNFEICYPSV